MFTLSNPQVQHITLVDPTPHAIVNELVTHINDIEEMYVIVKTKDGNWQESMVGDLQGLVFASFILSESAGKAL